MACWAVSKCGMRTEVEQDLCVFRYIPALRSLLVFIIPAQPGHCFTCVHFHHSDVGVLLRNLERLRQPAVSGAPGPALLFPKGVKNLVRLLALQPQHRVGDLRIYSFADEQSRSIEILSEHDIGLGEVVEIDDGLKPYYF